MQGIVRRPPQNSPILDLPDDVTYNIFLACRHDDPQNLQAIALAVCSQWRDTALSFPTLWSTINLDESLQNQQVVRKIETQLKRAQMTRLDIHIFESAIHQPETRSMLQITKLIFPSVQRWRSLVIERSVPDAALQVLFDSLAKASAPQLEKLAIEPGPFKWHSEMETEWKFQASSSSLPNLRCLHLSRCTFDWNADIFNNLVKLEVRGHSLLKMDRDELVTLIRDLIVRSPRLRSLVIPGNFWRNQTIHPDRSPPTHPQEIITHNTIQCLRIPLYGEVADALLHSVKMPSLEQVTADTVYYILPFSFPTLAHVNPLPNLRLIRISGYENFRAPSAQESAALPLALRAMCSLELLEFQNLDLTGNTYWLPDLLVWLPRLKGLMLDSCPGLLDSAIKEMVQRCSSPKRLTLMLSSTVEFDGKSREAWKDSMKELYVFLSSRLKEVFIWM
ncbi:hypothetical protein M407DRAFT_216525 [Tulasnella calospora MUT 4182]|uniref:Uncharacterized protein n=1 Tax=Tulasnella calospora MUT 4182 TaxID=1051891 RepID=A0A0C3ME19_9AGAM|nr:hypothetical protein M407DRAFT_216525 [Tulasnella calospora MUT 4182]